MKALTFVTVAAAAVALTLAPAAAKSKKTHPRTDPQQYGQTYGYAPPTHAPYGWTSRNASDPSLGHPSAADISRWSGRCVEDLGYGRYEACGW
ncbi:MAG: hypothetical protein WDO17_19715 [Alphaproteobacteria bacterium]